jgi:serine/threonine protein kinase
MAPADNWEQVQQIFLAVADLADAERAHVLEQMCQGDKALRAEVESLLDADLTNPIEIEATIESEATAALLYRPPVEGSRVGPYRLIREIGRGGMGSVYLAERADEQYESEVAIKLVRPGFDIDFILRRFRRERQILARLQHPNIARLFDGGTTEDQIPYLVMEYIRGSWITAYAAEHRLGVEERLKLFLPVCSAVEYAHRAFIVHRDLKPANILIDQSGTPKLLDFGISKLLHSEAQQDTAETQGIRMITPDYASPEQIVGDPVTIASDIYSLGVVLYELLTGERPHRIEKTTPLAVERAICLEPTVTPSAAVRGNPALSKRLAGDLDTIILCAMQKEPERRYTSVEQLAEDMRRHLDHRPVLARPDSLSYRAGKFIRRNRVSLTLAALVAVAAVGVTDAVTYEARTGADSAAYGRIGQAADPAGALLQLGDLSAAGRNRAAAMGYYRMALAAAEAVLAGNPQDGSAAQRQLIEASGKLALEQARAQDRSAAIATLEKALKTAQDADQIAKQRAWQAAASVFAALAENEGGAQRVQDQNIARRWQQQGRVP